MVSLQKRMGEGCKGRGRRCKRRGGGGGKEVQEEGREGGAKGGQGSRVEGRRHTNLLS